MSTFAKCFKDEVSRLARKETKAAVAHIPKPSASTAVTLLDALVTKGHNRSE